MTNRRTFLKFAAAGLAAPAFTAFAAGEGDGGRVLVIFLRGGLDGLFAFSPIADPRLGDLRPSLSTTVREQGIPLGTTGFAAHPACRPLAAWFAAGELAFAPCAGTIDTSRSHFQAQDLFELGSGNIRGTSGFMARAGDVLSPARGAISFTREIPLAFQGGATAPEVAPVSGSGLKLPPGRLLDAIRNAHAGRPTGAALDQALATEALIESATGMDAQAARGAPGTGAFRRIGRTIGRILGSQPRLSLAFLDLGGFDTHAGEESVLTRSLADLGDGLEGLREALGEAEWRRTRVVLMSEFGRTARENGTRGTDHGHGGLMLLCGGIRGGRMIGDFPGLEERSLYERRDLPVLVDWRTVLAACMRDAYAWNERTLDGVFPGRPRQRIDL